MGRRLELHAESCMSVPSRLRPLRAFFSGPGRLPDGAKPAAAREPSHHDLPFQINADSSLST
jgi:hypothetical protein